MFKSAKDLFATLSPAKRKKARRDLSEEMFDAEDDLADSQAPEPPKTSFNEADKAFLMEMTKIMAGHTESAITPIKEAVTDLQRENAELKREITALKAGAAPTDIDKIAKIVSEKLTLSPPPGLGKVSDSQSSTAATDVSTQDPLCFVIGGLGRDLTREQAMAKTREVLQEAQIAQDQFIDLYAPYAFGSICHVVFSSVQVGLQAIRKIRLLKKDCGQINGEGLPVPVWCDRKKSRSERLPYLTLMSLFKVAKADLTNQEVKASDYIKCGASRRVFCNSRSQVLLCLSRDGEVEWGSWAKGTFSEEQLANALAKAMAQLN